MCNTYCDFCCDYTVCGELDRDNDYSSKCLDSMYGKRIMFSSGYGFKPRFEFDEKLSDGLMHTTLCYFPRYCPNCGRFLYDSEEDDNVKI